MNTLTLSAHRLDKAACPYRLWMYQHAHGTGRAPAEVGPARVQGIAGHGSLALWRQGHEQAKQDAFVDRVFTAHPPPLEDFRTPAYLKDALRQYKAEHRELEQFEFEAVEDTFNLPLGELPMGDRTGNGWAIRLQGRRDAVGICELDGKRWLIDNKFVSRDEQAELSSARNSRALKAYVWSWQEQNPDKPIHGVMLRRLVIRKPTKDKPLNVLVPLDPPMLSADLFTAERLAEWRHNTLRLAAQIAARDPSKAADWPMDESHCRGTWGCCDYLSVCVLPPQDRLVKLASDAFKPAGERESWEVGP